MAHPAPELRELLTPGEVAVLFRVSRRTLTKWANRGWLDSIRTPGGTRRYDAVQVRAKLAESRTERAS